MHSSIPTILFIRCRYRLPFILFPFGDVVVRSGLHSLFIPYLFYVTFPDSRSLIRCRYVLFWWWCLRYLFILVMHSCSFDTVIPMTVILPMVTWPFSLFDCSTDDYRSILMMIHSTYSHWYSIPFVDVVDRYSVFDEHSVFIRYSDDDRPFWFHGIPGDIHFWSLIHSACSTYHSFIRYSDTDDTMIPMMEISTFLFIRVIIRCSFFARISVTPTFDIVDCSFYSFHSIPFDDPLFVDWPTYIKILFHWSIRRYSIPFISIDSIRFDSIPFCSDPVICYSPFCSTALWHSVFCCWWCIPVRRSYHLFILFHSPILFDTGDFVRYSWWYDDGAIVVLITLLFGIPFDSTIRGPFNLLPFPIPFYHSSIWPNCSITIPTTFPFHSIHSSFWHSFHSTPPFLDILLMYSIVHWLFHSHSLIHSSVRYIVLPIHIVLHSLLFHSVMFYTFIVLIHSTHLPFIVRCDILTILIHFYILHFWWFDAFDTVFHSSTYPFTTFWPFHLPTIVLQILLRWYILFVVHHTMFDTVHSVILLLMQILPFILMLTCLLFPHSVHHFYHSLPSLPFVVLIYIVWLISILFWSDTCIHFCSTVHSLVDSIWFVVPFHSLPVHCCSVTLRLTCRF